MAGLAASFLYDERLEVLGAVEVPATRAAPVDRTARYRVDPGGPAGAYRRATADKAAHGGRKPTRPVRTQKVVVREGLAKEIDRHRFDDYLSDDIVWLSVVVIACQVDHLA